MKYYLMGIGMAITLTISACNSNDDCVISQTELPKSAQIFLSEKFADPSIVKVELDKSHGTQHYDVDLSDRTEIEFDQAGNWTEVDCKSKAVPSDIIPQAIDNYAKVNYPGILINKIERDKYGYEIELQNNIEIRFDKIFNVVEIEK